MATRITALTLASALEDTDILYVCQTPSAVPADRKVEAQQIADYVYQRGLATIGQVVGKGIGPTPAWPQGSHGLRFRSRWSGGRDMGTGATCGDTIGAAVLAWRAGQPARIHTLCHVATDGP